VKLIPPICALALVLTACSAEPTSPAPEPATVAAPASPIDNGWDPKTGRGVIRVERPDGGLVEIRLHDGFAGYTGGTVLGSQNGPAFRYWPAGADREGKPLAIWCAQDESLRDRARDLEYTWGWSENIGRGADGVPLRLVRGAVLEDGPEGLILASEHAAAPLHVVRRMLVTPDAAVLHRVVFTNAGDAPFAFDLWSGDDPWVGEYGTAEGDRGWWNGGLFDHETSLDPALVRCLGVVDRDVRLTEDAEPVAAANAFCLGPDSPTPSAIYYANRFAHGPDEVAPDQPLDDGSMTAFNVGWTDVELAPGASFEVAYLLGMAEVPEAPDAVPIPPRVTDADWRRLAEAHYELADPADRPDPLRFARERVELEVLEGGQEVEIRGHYVLANSGDRRTVRRIYFPFAVDAAHPYPTDVSVSTGRHDRLRDGIVFGVDAPPHGEVEFDVRYRQRTTDRSATYIVTSARSWNDPLDEAVLVVSGPAGWMPEALSFPMQPRTDGSGRVTHETVIERFFPDRELSVSW
jgi:hypothetical protein